LEKKPIGRKREEKKLPGLLDLWENRAYARHPAITESERPNPGALFQKSGRKKKAAPPAQPPPNVFGVGKFWFWDLRGRPSNQQPPSPPDNADRREKNTSRMRKRGGEGDR